jgi:transcription initiation factor TFIID subunit TAF12
MILFILIIFVLTVWLINRLLFGELFGGGGDDEQSATINDTRWQQRNQYQQYQQFQQRERERQQNRRYEDGPIIIEKADATLVKPRKKAIGDYGEYVEFREVEE